MIEYQYQVVRYLHDQFTGEFANVGIVLYAPEKHYLSCKVVSRYARLSDFFGNINGQFLLETLRRLRTVIAKLQNEESGFFTDITTHSDISKITSYALPKDDSALQFSEVAYGIDVSPEAALNNLYKRLIEKYNKEEKGQRQTDQQVWSQVYRNYFERYGLTNKLNKHQVHTSKDSIEFEKAWKNGVWNCYQPLALNLSTDEAIKSKVYKWSGIIRELETTNEKVHLYFLTTTPQQHTDLSIFIQDKLTCNDGNLIVDLVKEEDAEAFATKVRRDMEQSNVKEGKANLF